MNKVIESLAALRRASDDKLRTEWACAQGSGVLPLSSAQLGIWFALINLVPLPPLTGSHLLTALFSVAGEPMRRYHIYFAFGLTALAATGLVTRVLEPVYRVVAEIILRA